jgi:CheY-like chemotaxis protein
MAKKIDILAIDDDKFIIKVIIKSLQSDSISIRTANDGESGIAEAIRKTPDIILLDVEMPGINGYEVCVRLRENEQTKEIPIVFLSSHSSLRERMQGYEVGADDYLVKPFEKDHLLARISILIKYQSQREELAEQYQIAQKNAILAMTGASELAIAMRFLEKSLSYFNINDLTQGLLDSTDQFSIDCCVMVIVNGQPLWYSSKGTVSPLEKELIEMNDKGARFLDFGARTIVNYPSVSLLVRNMPLEDAERYGRIKDILPILLSAVNTKINVLNTQAALSQQSTNILGSIKMIRRNLFHLGSTILQNRQNSSEIMYKLVQGLNYDFMGMGLEEDQEEYLLTTIDTTIEKAMEEMDAGKEIKSSLTFILTNLNTLMISQEALFTGFTESLATEADEEGSDMDDGVELF